MIDIYRQKANLMLTPPTRVLRKVVVLGPNLLSETNIVAIVKIESSRDPIGLFVLGGELT